MLGLCLCAVASCANFGSARTSTVSQFCNINQKVGHLHQCVVPIHKFMTFHFAHLMCSCISVLYMADWRDALLWYRQEPFLKGNTIIKNTYFKPLTLN